MITYAYCSGKLLVGRCRRACSWDSTCLDRCGGKGTEPVGRYHGHTVSSAAISRPCMSGLLDEKFHFDGFIDECLMEPMMRPGPFASTIAAREMCFCFFCLLLNPLQCHILAHAIPHSSKSCVCWEMKCKTLNHCRRQKVKWLQSRGLVPGSGGDATAAKRRGSCGVKASVCCCSFPVNGEGAGKPVTSTPKKVGGGGGL